MPLLLVTQYNGIERFFGIDVILRDTVEGYSLTVGEYSAQASPPGSAARTQGIWTQPPPARMGIFEETMVALAKAVIFSDKPGADKYAGRLTEALRGNEKDVPRRNVSRIREFQSFYNELKKRTAKLASNAKSGNLRKTSLSYGRVLEVCVSCHAKFRD